MDADLELLEAWRAGDDGAGNRLFEGHFDAIYRFFYGKVEDSIAEELAQETFLSIVRHRDGVASHCSFRAYLFTIARNKLYDLLRKRGREARGVDFSVASLAELGPTPTGALAHHQQRKLLLQALRSLPVELQVLLELRYFEELRGPELAEVLGLAEGTVRSRLRRAHRLLREQLEHLGSSPAEIESTISDLEDWAKLIRDDLDPQ